jgi:uncharacterized protein (TIGR02145 family)
MKSIILLCIFLIVLSSVALAQNYQISFVGTGASTIVDSVKVENLTQCTSMTIGGSDILHLTTTVGVDMQKLSPNRIQICPNPVTEFCTVTLAIEKETEATTGLYDISEKCILARKWKLDQANPSFRISGLSKGVYILKIESETFSACVQIVSMSNGTANAEIRQIEPNPEKLLSGDFAKLTKSEKAIVSMLYSDGDLLKLTGKSGNYRTVVMLTPANSQTVSLYYIPCTDANGNHYPIVQIGSQWWMAENLNAGTYVPVTTPQVSGTKFCMDVNGQADPNCPMGGLYEWSNLMQGATSCNGTGAPPDDACATPVQGLCPNGWHIPSHYEWTSLERNSGSNPGAFPYNTSTISLLGTDEGGNLKMNCTSYWWAPNAGATNSTGFSGLPGGDTWNGVFEDYGQSAYFWTSTKTYFMSWVHALNYSLTVVGRSNYAVESGFSCRCVKD